MGLAAVVTPAAAQEPGGAVTGEAVTPAGAPIPGVQVLLDDTILIGQTDSAGRFRLAGLDPGSIEVTLRKIGFRPTILATRFPASGERHYRLTMRPFIPQLDEVRISVDPAIPSVIFELQQKWEEKRQVHTLFAEDLARYNLVSVDELFRRVGEFAFILGMPPRGAVCAVVDDRWVPEGWTLGDYVSVDDVAAIQVIRSADLVPSGLLPTPRRRGYSPRIACKSVILVYTKWFRPRESRPRQ